MSEIQVLTIALATVPTVVAVLVGILINNSRLSDLRSYMEARFNEVDRRFSSVDHRFEEMDRKMDQRFDDAKETWRAELHRVEEVLDARLKHIEQR
jgi:hypothetical protein